MLKDSKASGDEERKIFATHKCWCDKSEARLTKTIADETRNIADQTSKLEEARAAVGVASSQKAQDEQDLADTIQEIDAAVSLRKQQAKDFAADKLSFETSIAQLGDAIKTLQEVGADQTMPDSAEDQKDFMAADATKAAKEFIAANKKKSLVSLKSQLSVALKMAERYVAAKKSKRAFLQNPSFSGTYSASSGEIVGILINMKDTFNANLKEATDVENRRIKEHGEFLELKEELKKNLKESISDLENEIADEIESGKNARKSRESSQTNKDTAETQLEEARVSCGHQASIFETRKATRAQEEAAIAEAISILNSDEAFDTFETTSAKRGSGFLQLGAPSRKAAAEKLQKVARDIGSIRLALVATRLMGASPFSVVLSEIDKLIARIDEEKKVDQETHDDYDTQDKENKKLKEQKEKAIEQLDASIKKLNGMIKTNNEVIKQTSEDINSMKNSLVDMAKERREEHGEYNQEVKEINKARSILQKAIERLKKFYERAAVDTIKQTNKSDGEAERLSSEYTHSESGAKVIGLLETIDGDNHKELQTESESEEEAQTTYSKAVVETSADIQRASEKLDTTLIQKAENTQKLLEKTKERKKTARSLQDVKDLLADIKPQVEYWRANLELRQTNQDAEKAALKKVISTLKGTPLFKEHDVAAIKEDLGECASFCYKDGGESLDAHPEGYPPCEACKRGITVQTYCTGEAKNKADPACEKFTSKSQYKKD